MRKLNGFMDRTGVPFQKAMSGFEHHLNAAEHHLITETKRLAYLQLLFDPVYQPLVRHDQNRIRVFLKFPQSDFSLFSAA